MLPCLGARECERGEQPGDTGGAQRRCDRRSESGASLSRPGRALHLSTCPGSRKGRRTRAATGTSKHRAETPLGLDRGARPRRRGARVAGTSDCPPGGPWRSRRCGRPGGKSRRAPARSCCWSRALRPEHPGARAPRPRRVDRDVSAFVEMSTASAIPRLRAGAVMSVTIRSRGLACRDALRPLQQGDQRRCDDRQRATSGCCGPKVEEFDEEGILNSQAGCYAPFRGGRVSKRGRPPGDRTRDTLIKSQVLYH